MQIKGLKINFLGDSITEGHCTSSLDHTFWNLLASRDGAVTRGYGIGGTRISRQQSVSPKPVYDEYFRTRIAGMDPDADAVFVFGGTNDYGHGDAAIGHFSDRNDDTFYGALHNLCTDLIARYPDALIVFLTPTHRLNENRVYNEWGVRSVGSLRDYVNCIREVTEYYSIPVIDLYRESGIQPEIPELRERFMPDGLHPNDAGHERIYSLVRDFLMRTNR